MWVTAKHDGTTVKINTEFISLLYPDDNTVVLSSGNEIALSYEDYENLELTMFPTRKKVAKDNTELAEFLNTLHKLTGGKNAAILTPQRNKKLTDLLKIMSPQQLIDAATNIGRDKWLQGENDNRKRYGDIDYLLSKDKNGNLNSAKWAEKKPDDRRKMF